jgi:hypothetical protein
MRRAPAWTVVAIVEDESDGVSLRQLLTCSRPEVTFDWLPANGIGNIKRRCPQLIRLALDRIRDRRGCVAVVIDGDRQDESRDEPHRSIARACADHGVALLVCREALEAWFLADPGCCRWLGIPLPDRSDGIADPKERVAEAFLRTTRRTYQKRRARLEIARQASGPDRQRNRSLEEALGHIDGCLSRGRARP